MLFFVVLVLALTGGIATGREEVEKLMQQELFHLSQNVEKIYGDTSVQAVTLSETLSGSIEKQLNELGLTTGDLQLRPDILESLLESQLTSLMLALEKTKCSGVFVVLDATVNSVLPGSEHSKAGIYLRNSEPNVVVADNSKLYLRGFPHIALRNKLSLQSKWDMEFYVEGQPYYHKPIDAYQKYKVSISRLYYWSYGGMVKNLDEKVMLCSIPLISSGGTVFGVCGFEISEMNFKLQFSPDTSVNIHAASFIAPLMETGFDTSAALYSGNIPVLFGSPIRFAGSIGNLSLYAQDNNSYVGLHRVIKTYPVNPPFAGEKNAFALLFPRAGFDSTLSGYNNRIALVCALALFFGVVLSALISRKYVKPIFEGLNILRSKENLDDDFRINIPEIDELVELIKSKQALASMPKSDDADDAGEDFLLRLETLTPAERDVFTLFVKGHTAIEAADKMKISINTIKTHSRKIYVKMNVTSRTELLSYCIGLADKIMIDRRQ
jgi:DNA-binding CsgD family transcriptional regulator